MTEAQPQSISRKTIAPSQQQAVPQEKSTEPKHSNFSMKIATLFGIDLYMHISTLVIIGLIGYSAGFLYGNEYPDSSNMDRFYYGLLAGVIIMVTVIIHEFAHALTAKAYNMEIKEIELNILGGATKIKRDPEKPGEEFKMAGIGPLSSLIMGGIFLSIQLFPISVSVFWTELFNYIGSTNIILGVFNLLPSYPMDGGRVLRAILWKRYDDYYKATRKAARVGMFMGSGLMGLGVFALFLTEAGLLSAIWFFFIGNTMRNTAQQAYQSAVISEKLSHIQVSRIMQDLRPQVSQDQYISEIIDRHFGNYQKRVITVLNENDEIIGILHVDDLKKISEDQRELGQVKEVFTPLISIPRIDDTLSAEDALQQFREHRKETNVLLVEDADEQLIGYLDTYDLEFALRVYVERS